MESDDWFTMRCGRCLLRDTAGHGYDAVSAEASVIDTGKQDRQGCYQLWNPLIFFQTELVWFATVTLGMYEMDTHTERDM